MLVVCCLLFVIGCLACPELACTVAEPVEVELCRSVEGLFVATNNQ